MLNLSNPWMKLFIESDGKKYLVSGIFKTHAEVNNFCLSDPNVPDVGVIVDDKETGLIFVADIKPTA